MSEAGERAHAHVKTHQMANGLRIVTDRMDHAATVSLAVHVSVGARHEKLDESGLCHLAEHMAFKGAGGRSAREIAEAVESAGGDFNAATSSEFTIYQIRALASQFFPVLDVLADVVTAPNYDPLELSREKEVIAQEIDETREDPVELAFESLDAAAFPDQPLGRSIAGSKQALARYETSDLEQFFTYHYGASRLIVSAAGALPQDGLVERVWRLFESHPRGMSQAPQTARYVGGSISHRRRIEQSHAAVGFEGFGHRDPRLIAAHLLANVLGEGSASRLFQELREKRGLCYSLYSFHESFSDTGLFGFYLAASPAKIGEAMNAAVDCAGAIVSTLNAKELSRAKAQLKMSLAAALESSSARVEQLARQMEVHGRVLPLAQTLQWIDDVTLKDVRAVAAVLLSRPPSLGVVSPRAAVPDAADIRQRLTGL